ncbi:MULTISPECIES: hypothetical protein [unclassified Pseudoalteromonas]|uniref:hypothetical protein n=1 Tax=unclassified Pseudoalteromonas TaxID=194690 RepID=UPI000C077398|nr:MULTISPECIES: hypothetical protein [unclassified Pseudoalteromonas]MDP2633262.1 hypothetical protein [Pseudoalteromonas sp. 1_MG-2023]PHN91763.1 hypothetical protein CSC79_01620 [Pseudoalteromonas sp. 3D05]
MTKTEKRLDNTLRKILTTACENIKDAQTEFSHLTHTINLKKPDSTLQVTCFFIDELALAQASSQQQLPFIERELIEQLRVVGLKPQTINFLAV